MSEQEQMEDIVRWILRDDPAGEAQAPEVPAEAILRRMFKQEFPVHIVRVQMVHTPDRCSMKYMYSNTQLHVWASDWLVGAPEEVLEEGVRRTACVIKCEEPPEAPALDAWMEVNRDKWKK